MSRTPAFCDGFALSTPKDNGPVLLDGLRPILDDLGCSLVNDGCYRTETGGALIYGTRGGVTWIEAKGQFVTALRTCRMLNDFLAVAALGPHRVTRCDLTVDQFVDSPADAVQRAYSLATSGGISFTRKSIKSDQVSKVLSPVLYDDTGKDTGTVYLGRRSAEAHGKLYDKTQERASVGECIGLTVRHELTLTSKLGISLKDISKPDPCFYNFWPSVLLSRPEGVPEWVPGGEGFSLDRSPERLPSQRLKYRVETSPDLGDMIRLAESVGPEGLKLLLRLIENRALKEHSSFATRH